MTLKGSNKKSAGRFKDTSFLQKVGERMQQLMTDRGITHEVFYNDTSINPHRLIIGQVNMTLSTFSRICQYLDITPEEFFKGMK